MRRSDSPSHDIDQSHRLVIKVPPMPFGDLRRSARHRTASASAPSGSEYSGNDKSDTSGHFDPPPVIVNPPEFRMSTSGRRIKVANYAEDATDDEIFQDEEEARLPKRNPRRITRQIVKSEDEFSRDDEMFRGGQQRYQMRTLPGSKNVTRSQSNIKKPSPPQQTRKKTSPSQHSTLPRSNNRKAKKQKRRSAEEEHQEGDYVDVPVSGSSSFGDAEFDGDASHEEVSHASPEPEADPEMDIDAEGDPEPEIGNQGEGKPYSFRERSKVVNYTIPPALEEMHEPPPRKNQSNGRAGGRKHGRKGPGWNTTGAELGRWMGDDSVRSQFIDFRTILTIL
jgi:hypothetical protein